MEKRETGIVLLMISIATVSLFLLDMGSIDKEPTSAEKDVGAYASATLATKILDQQAEIERLKKGWTACIGSSVEIAESLLSDLERCMTLNDKCIDALKQCGGVGFDDKNQKLNIRWEEDI